MSKRITEILTRLTIEISTINTKEDLELIVDQFNIYKVQFFKKEIFMDFPYPNLTVLKNDSHSSYLYR
jgi:hypothetical protein